MQTANTPAANWEPCTEDRHAKQPLALVQPLEPPTPQPHQKLDNTTTTPHTQHNQPPTPMKILNTTTNEIEALTYNPTGSGDQMADLSADDTNINRVSGNADYDATADQSTIDWWIDMIDKMEERDGLVSDLKAKHPNEAQAVLEEMTQWHSGGDMEMGVNNQIKFLSSLLGDLDLISSQGSNYHQGAHAPDWWDIIQDSPESEIILESATMGSSPNNEWYAFRDRAAAVSHIRSAFDRQAFVDNYTYIDETSEYYRTDDLDATETDDGEISYSIPSGVKPASLAEMIACESRF